MTRATLAAFVLLFAVGSTGCRAGFAVARVGIHVAAVAGAVHVASHAAHCDCGDVIVVEGEPPPPQVVVVHQPPPPPDTVIVVAPPPPPAPPAKSPQPAGWFEAD